MKLHKTPSARRQQGAILIMTAAFIVAAVALLALAVDTGRLYAAQAKLQSAANLAALDTARYVGGCRKLPDDEDSNKKNLIAQANTAMGRSYDGPSPTVVASDFDTGIVKTNNGLRAFADTPDGAHPTAVRLTAEDSNYQPLFTSFFGKTAPLRASAGATNPVRAEISTSGQLAHVDPKIFPQLLGGTNADVLDPSGLADASVNLADLATKLGVATPKQLLETPVALNVALGALGDVTSGAASTTLDALSDFADSQQVVLGNVLGIVGDPGKDLAVNAAAITGALATLAAENRKKPIKLDIAQTLLPSNIADVSVLVRLLPPPAYDDGFQIAIGPPGEDGNGKPLTTVKSAQALVQINIGLLKIAGYSLSNLTLFVELGRTDANLVSIDCAHAGQPEHVVKVAAKGEAGQIGVGTISDLSGKSPSAKPEASKLLDLGVASITVKTDSPVLIPGGKAVPPLEFRGPFPAIAPLEPETKSIDGENAGTALSEAVGNLGSNLDIKINIVGIPISVSAVLKPLTGLLKPILAPLLSPVFGALGVSVGGGEVTVDSVDTNQPQLFCASTGDCFPTQEN